jgi:hypothetical protein
MYHYGWDDANMFNDWLEETKDSIRIFLILGDSDTHLGLLVSISSTFYVQLLQVKILKAQKERWLDCTFSAFGIL